MATPNSLQGWKQDDLNREIKKSLENRLCRNGSPNLSFPKNRNRKSLRFQIANCNSRRRFRREMAENSWNEIAKRCVSESQILNCNVFFAFQTAKTSRRCPNFQKYVIATIFRVYVGTISNGSVSAFSKSQRFRDAVWIT